MARLHSGLAAISSYLLPVAPARHVAHPYGRPAQPSHDFCESSKRAGSATALWHFKEVQQRL